MARTFVYPTNQINAAIQTVVNQNPSITLNEAKQIYNNRHQTRQSMIKARMLFHPNRNPRASENAAHIIFISLNAPAPRNPRRNNNNNNTRFVSRQRQLSTPLNIRQTVRPEEIPGFYRNNSSTPPRRVLKNNLTLNVDPIAYNRSATRNNAWVIVGDTTPTVYLRKSLENLAKTRRLGSGMTANPGSRDMLGRLLNPVTRKTFRSIAPLPENIKNRLFGRRPYVLLE